MTLKAPWATSSGVPPGDTPKYTFSYLKRFALQFGIFYELQRSKNQILTHHCTSAAKNAQMMNQLRQLYDLELALDTFNATQLVQFVNLYLTNTTAVENMVNVGAAFVYAPTQ